MGPGQAIIVGGGVGGPALGLWLRRLGWRVVLIEARSKVADTEGAFLGLAPNGMNVLALLGLADEVERSGSPCEGFRFDNRRGQTLGQIQRHDDRSRYGWPLTMIRRGALSQLLVRAAEAHGVEVHYGGRVEGVADLPRARPGSAVEVRLASGEALSADLVFGCDGARSSVRRAVFPEAPGPVLVPLQDFGGFAPALPGLPFPKRVNEMVFGRRAFFGAYRTEEEQVWWFHNGPVLSATDWREHLLALHQEDPAWISELIRSTPTILGPWQILEQRGLKRWSRGRVCLLGDAAHVMPPSAGQGASLAIEDAMVLARCLRDCADHAQAFVTYERLRRPRVADHVRQARRNGSGKAVQGPLSEWIRDRMLPLFLKWGGAAQDRSYGFKVSW